MSVSIKQVSPFSSPRSSSFSSPPRSPILNPNPSTLNALHELKITYEQFTEHTTSKREWKQYIASRSNGDRSEKEPHRDYDLRPKPVQMTGHISKFKNKSRDKMDAINGTLGTTRRNHTNLCLDTLSKPLVPQKQMFPRSIKLKLKLKRR